MDEKVKEIASGAEKIAISAIEAYISKPVGLTRKWEVIKFCRYLLSHISTLEGRLRLQQSALDRWVPCPDHRDKVKSQCYVCENERLERKMKEKDKELEDALHLRDIHRESAQYFEKKWGEAEEKIRELEERYEREQALYQLIEGD